MSNPTIRIHDVTTNEVIDREMTDEEFAQYQIEQAKQAAKDAELADAAAAKQALLDRLGITADEAKLLLS